MKRVGLPLTWLVGVLILAQAWPACAGSSVILRRDLASGPTITLGDLFEGAGAARSVVVGNGAPAGEDAVLDAAVVQRIAHINGLDWANSAGILRIIVRGLAVAPPLADKSAATIDVLAYSRSLSAGEMVRPGDLTFAKVPAFAAPTDAPRDASEIIGKVARMPLRSGAAVSIHDVSNAQVIKRDDLVQVVYRADGITVALQAKAMGPAALGDTFNVLNTASKKVIQAVAVGPDQAVVGPEASQIKSSAFPVPSLFADNR